MFLFMIYLNEHFHIATDHAMDSLNDMLSNTIKEAYTKLPNLNMWLLDFLDLNFYDEILKLRAKFNN